MWKAALLCSCVLLAGCSSAPMTDSPAQSITTSDPACVTTPDYEKRAVPARPTNVTHERARWFAGTHAEALAWNDAYGAADAELGVDAEASIVNQTDEGYLVFVTGGVSYSLCENGSRAVASGGFHATYFINDSTALRLPFPDNRSDDPREHGGETIG